VQTIKYQEYQVVSICRVDEANFKDFDDWKKKKLGEFVRGRIGELAFRIRH
jgi:hypothetical protein